MDKKRIAIVAGIVAVLLVLLIAISSIGSNKEPADLQTDEPKNGLLQPVVEIISVNHQFEDGKHTIVGNLTLPTPCHSYNAVPNFQEDGTVVVEITTESSDEMCAQVITDATFRVEFEGDEDLVFMGTLNDNPIIFNVFEVPAGENIDDYESMIKG